MLTFATDFWPLFWTVLGSAAALAVLCTVMIATMGSQPQPVPVPVENSTYLAELAAAERAHERQAA
jgi:hypothetical protein